MSKRTTNPHSPGHGPEKEAHTSAKVASMVAPLAKASLLELRMSGAERPKKAPALLRGISLNGGRERVSSPSLPQRLGYEPTTYMIMGRVDSRRNPFRAFGHGRPTRLNPAELEQLSEAVRATKLNYLVIASGNRDDLPDGGAAQFVKCIQAVRAARPEIKVEILTPDFRGKVDVALDALTRTPPDLFNHNLETVPRLYRKARPGADYEGSLELIRRFGRRCPDVPTKSGLMLGLGEEMEEIRSVMRDLRTHGCRMLTIGQYLPPSDNHLPVKRYLAPADFDGLQAYGEYIGFEQVASGSLVRSSYYANAQAAVVL